MAASSATIRPHRRPLALGVALAPWAAPIALAVLAAVVEGASAAAVVEMSIFAIAFGMPIAYAGMLLIGLPLSLWLRARGKLTAWRLCLIAPLLGSASLVLGLALMGAKLGTLATICLGAILALVVALAFCLLCGIPWRAPPQP